MINKQVKGGISMQTADTVTGVITVSIAGITAALTPSDAREWGNTLIQLGPLLIIVFLIYRLRMLDKKLDKCEEKHADMSEKLLVAYSAALRPNNPHLPDPHNFMAGNFSVTDCIDDSCTIEDHPNRRAKS